MHYDYGRNKSECPEPIKAEVKGSLPHWLQGTLVRNGSGLFSVGESSYNHWFDGMALLHNFTIKHEWSPFLIIPSQTLQTTVPAI
uniref:Uncharacterized protein n=1 Tax=Electrophorus electricus TaxID=8005 RepID=A0AAY5ENY9_ELEEL